MYIATIFLTLLAIFSLVGYAEPSLTADGWPGVGCLASRTGNPCLFSPWSTGLLRPDRLCRAATGSGRKDSRVRTTDRRHSQACRARPFCPTHAREGYGQKGLNSVWQFKTLFYEIDATLPTSPGLYPWTPRRFQKQFGSHGSAAQICFLRLRPKGLPFGIPRLQ